MDEVRRQNLRAACLDWGSGDAGGLEENAG